MNLEKKIYVFADFYPFDDQPPHTRDFSRELGSFSCNAKHATEAVKEITEIVKKNWQRLANKYGISKNEIDRMHPAFMKAEEYL